MRHFNSDIFVCPERVFRILNGVIEDQDYFVDYWKDGYCRFCGVKKEENEEKIRELGEVCRTV